MFLLRDVLSTDQTTYRLFSLGSLVFVVLSFSFGTYAYLRGDLLSSSKISDPILEEYLAPPYEKLELEKIRREINNLKKGIQSAQVGSVNLSQDQQQALVETLKLQLQGSVVEEIVKLMEQKYSAQISENAQAQPIRNAFTAARERLYSEIKSLTRRNNVNLTIGAATTAIAVGLLTYLVLGSPQQTFGNIPDLLAHFIPRVSVAAFIEVFSFFFLKLYKSGIQEIKYFQNELTNIDMRVVALESTFLTTPNALTEKIAPTLASTDRNVASTGLTNAKTADGQQLDAKSLLSLLENFSKLISAGKS